MNKHEYFIKKTYDLAQQAQHKGNHPFAALLVINQEIIISAENTVITQNDVTCHAELNLVKKASQQYKHKDLNQAILYTSTEPCAMCSGAIFWSGISHVVFGCSAKKLGQITTGSFVIPCSHIFSYGNRSINISGPILEEQGAQIHKEFWI